MVQPESYLAFRPSGGESRLQTKGAIAVDTIRWSLGELWLGVFYGVCLVLLASVLSRPLNRYDTTGEWFPPRASTAVAASGVLAVAPTVARVPAW